MHDQSGPRTGQGADRILSSQLLLLREGGSTLVLKHPMDFMAVADSDDPDTGAEWGDPLVQRGVLVVALSKEQEVTV